MRGCLLPNYVIGPHFQGLHLRTVPSLMCHPRAHLGPCLLTIHSLEGIFSF